MTEAPQTEQEVLTRILEYLRRAAPEKWLICTYPIEDGNGEFAFTQAGARSVRIRQLSNLAQFIGDPYGYLQAADLILEYMKIPNRYKMRKPSNGSACLGVVNFDTGPYKEPPVFNVSNLDKLKDSDGV